MDPLKELVPILNEDSNMRNILASSADRGQSVMSLQLDLMSKDLILEYPPDDEFTVKLCKCLAFDKVLDLNRPLTVHEQEQCLREAGMWTLALQRNWDKQELTTSTQMEFTRQPDSFNLEPVKAHRVRSHIRQINDSFQKVYDTQNDSICADDSQPEEVVSGNYLGNLSPIKKPEIKSPVPTVAHPPPCSAVRQLEIELKESSSTTQGDAAHGKVHCSLINFKFCKVDKKRLLCNDDHENEEKQDTKLPKTAQEQDTSCARGVVEEAVLLESDNVETQLPSISKEPDMSQMRSCTEIERDRKVEDQSEFPMTPAVLKQLRCRGRYDSIKDTVKKRRAPGSHSEREDKENSLRATVHDQHRDGSGVNNKGREGESRMPKSPEQETKVSPLLDTARDIFESQNTCSPDM